MIPLCLLWCRRVFLGRANVLREARATAHGDEASKSHGDREETVAAQGNELLRQCCKRCATCSSKRERTDLARVPPAKGVEVRARVRHLEMQVRPRDYLAARHHGAPGGTT